MDWQSDLLKTSVTSGARVEQTGVAHWRLSIPPGPAGVYRLAELDDYTRLTRRAFPWNPPFELSLRARASAASIPGTWGFGLWNDPFGSGLLSRAGGARLPALPQAAWFFFASPSNYLSFRDDLPAQGALAATFRSVSLPPALLALGLPAYALMAIPAVARLLRRFARRYVQQDATALQLDPTEWHIYRMEWRQGSVHFQVDEQPVLQMEVAPMSPLGLVIWIDNQYAAFPPDGRLRYGTLATAAETWIEVIGA
jgi:hypothetical protein